MSERIFLYVLAAGLAAAVLWRFTPPQAAPIDTLSDTMGQPVTVPTLDAEHVIGMSYSVEDGEPGPALYCANYPGARPLMPPIPPAATRG